MLLENSNIQVDQALIVDEPWVSKIMAGEKIWEMRSTPNAKTGWVGLIRKGSGLIVGLMKINGSQGPLTKAQLHSHFDKHKVGPELINNDNYKWFHAWQITEVKRFDTPVRYSHPNGAVIWVNLDEEAKAAVQKKFGEQPTEAVALNKKAPVDKQVTAPLCEGKSISIVLTQGNINNDYLKIPREGDFFPAAIWGGNNKSNEGTKAVFQLQGIEHPVETDIDGGKRVLRSRGAIGAFFKLHRLSAGDEVVITRNSDFSFGVGFKKIAGVK